MFRPPSHHPQGGPPRYNAPYPGHTLGMTVGAPFVPPPFPMHGRGGFQAPFHGGHYHGFPPSGPPGRPSPTARPPPPPESPPSEAPPPPPPSASHSEGNFRSTSKPAPPPPPPMPKDAEMLKNIEVLSSFVVKNGPQFENMARAKQAGDPKFSFLFGGERGTEAALGFDFYNWKKDHLTWVEERARALPAADQQRLSDANMHGNVGGSGVVRLSDEPPASPTGSDMDMEDDFTLPAQISDKKPDSDKYPSSTVTASERKAGLSLTGNEMKAISSPGREGKSELDWRSASSVLAPDRKPVLASHDSAELKLGGSLGMAGDRQSSHNGSQRGSSVQLSTPDLQVSRGSLGEKTLRVSDSGQAQREIASSDLPKRRDTRRRTGFDRPCMENVSPQDSPVRVDQHKNARSTHWRESLPARDYHQKGIFGNGHQEVTTTRPSRWAPPDPSSDNMGSGVAIREKEVELGQGTSVGKVHKKLDAFAHNRGDNTIAKDRSQSPDAAARSLRAHDDFLVKDFEKLQPKAGSDQLAVDEFGRLVRQGGSDSDDDGDHYNRSRKRRRTLSRSRSRSPGDVRGKHWSLGHSPHRRGRRSRSRSRSPRRNRSCSHTPPREGKRGLEGRGDRGPLEKGGRRAGRGVGGPCFDFSRGKCFRGSSCRFSHEESNGGTASPGGRWGGSRGRGRAHGHTVKESGEEGERSWGVRGAEEAKLLRAWEMDERTTETDSKEMKVIEELKKQGQDLSGDDSLKQDEGTSVKPLVSTAEEPRQTGECQPAKSTSELSPKAAAPSAMVSMTLQSQSSISARPVLPAVPQMAVLPNPLASKQQSGLTSNAPSATHQLSNLVSTSVPQQLSYMVSPTPHSQQLQFIPAVSHIHQPAFSTPLQPQQPGYHPNLASLPQNKGFTANNVHQQPAFTSARNVFSGSPPVPSLQPPFTGRPMGFPQTSFNAVQQPSFPQFSNNNGPGSIQFRLPVGAAQPPPMLGSNLAQNLLSRPVLPWMPTGAGPPVSNPLGPQHTLQPLPTQSLQPPPSPSLQPPPPQSLQPPPPQSLQPPPPQTLQPPPPVPPPQVSATPAIVYSYSLPLSYPVPTYSMVSSKPVTPQPSFTSDQYDPLADSLEPAPPGSGEKKRLISNNQSSSQDSLRKRSAVESWRHHAGNLSAPLMTNAGEVVLENVSPGLPGHIDNMGRGSSVIGSVVHGSQSQVVMENVSPTNAVTSVKGNVPVSMGGSQDRVLEDTHSPPDHNPAEAAEGHQESQPKTKEQKKKDKEGRVLNLIRKAVAEHVKDLLKPTWKEGQMSKDAFKTIAKKAVDKVMGALECKGQIPKSQEKLDSFMETSKPKIAKLVQGYVDKYVKM